MRYPLYFLIMLPVLCLLAGCSTIQSVTPAEQGTSLTEETMPESMLPSETVSISLLTSPDDIGLCDTDGEDHDYTFCYDGKMFCAVYTPDHWKVIDSFLIRNTADIVYICQALKDVHPIHSADMEGYRTAEDMAYEWLQHNIAYDLLSDDSEWKAHVRDVDIDPKDQGKSVFDLYQDRMGLT